MRQRTLSKGEGAEPPDVSSVTGVSCLTLPVPGSPRLKTARGDAHLGWRSVRGVCGEGADQAGNEVRMKTGSIRELQSMAQAFKKWFLSSLGM